MRPDDYPPQEPFSAVGARYHEQAMRLGEGIEAPHEARYGSDPYQSLSLFPASQPTGDVLVFWHGGGWTNGYKEWLHFMAPALNDAGVTFVSAGYRLAPLHRFPAGLEDAAAALQCARTSVADHGGDADRLFIGGHSAGGHYASLLALTGGAGAIRGVLPISGVFLFGDGSGLSARPRFLGDEPDVESAASPLRHVAKMPPPFLLAHGDRDFPHLIRQAEEMEATLRHAGGDVRRLVLADCDHFEASYISGRADGPWLPQAVDWMRAH